MNYYDLLKSPQWHVRRKKWIFDADYRCQLCSAEARPLHIHHNNYERVGRERDSDVVVLCASCHWWVHVVIAPKFWWARLAWWMVDLLNKGSK